MSFSLLVYKIPYFLFEHVNRNTRLERCESAFWDFGTNLPKEYKEFLNSDEKLHLNKYKNLIQNYSQALDMDIDLSKVFNEIMLAFIMFL